MDFDLARFMVTRKEKENSDTHTSYPSPSKKAYKKEMETTLFKNANVADNNRIIISFKGKFLELWIPKTRLRLKTQEWLSAIL